MRTLKEKESPGIDPLIGKDRIEQKIPEKQPEEKLPGNEGLEYNTSRQKK